MCAWVVGLFCVFVHLSVRPTVCLFVHALLPAAARIGQQEHYDRIRWVLLDVFQGCAGLKNHPGGRADTCGRV